MDLCSISSLVPLIKDTEVEKKQWQNLANTEKGDVITQSGITLVALFAASFMIGDLSKEILNIQI